MAGASSEDGDASTTASGGSLGTGPSAGGSGALPGSGGGEPTGGTGGASTGGNAGVGGDASSNGDAGFGASGGTAGIGGDASGGAGGSSNLPFCSWGYYDTDDTDDELTCAPWAVCGPGEFQLEFGDATHNRVCAPCPEGSWNANVSSSCKPTTDCRFGQEVETEPTPTSDRVCKTADEFPEEDLGDYVVPGPLVVTDDSAYLLVDVAYTDAVVLRYSLEGVSLGYWPAAESQASTTDLTQLGDDLILAGIRPFEDTDAGTFSHPGFVRSFTPNGTLNWEYDFDAQPDEHFNSADVAIHGGVVYALALVRQNDCPLTMDGYTCSNPSPPAHLVLSVIDADGTEVTRDILEADTNVDRVSGFTVASDGQIYVVVTRVTRTFADNCDEIDPDYDYYYYYLQCVTGVPSYRDALLQFDGTELIHEHPLRESYPEVLKSVSADDSGNVYVLMRLAGEYVLYRSDGSGDALQEDVLDVPEGEWVEQFAITDTGLALVGAATNGPLLLRTDPDGEVLSRHVVEQMELPFRLGGVAEADDGRLFIGGTFYDTAFVVPWPE